MSDGAVFGEYQATVMREGSTRHCPPRALLAEAMADADEHADADVQVVRLSPARRVVAGREVGGAWLYN
jgi:hypothetical protein